MASISSSESITGSRTQLWTNTIREIEVDVPVLNKFLCCLPIRVGLIIWGYLMLFAITSITVGAINHFSMIVTRHDDLLWVGQATGMFVITMIVTLVEVIFAILLLCATHKKSVNLLYTVYRYYTVKLSVYALLLLTCFLVKHMAHSEFWFFRNVDPFRYFVLYDCPQVGFVDCLVQLYIAILIRSEIFLLKNGRQRIYVIAAPSAFPYQALPSIIDPAAILEKDLKY